MAIASWTAELDRLACERVRRPMTIAGAKHRDEQVRPAARLGKIVSSAPGGGKPDDQDF